MVLLRQLTQFVQVLEPVMSSRPLKSKFCPWFDLSTVSAGTNGNWNAMSIKSVVDIRLNVIVLHKLTIKSLLEVYRCIFTQSELA